MRLPTLRRSIYLPGNAWILAFTAFVWSIGGAISNPYQPIYFSALGANPIFIGYLLALNSGITALMQLIGGYVADSWGRRKVIAIFSFLGAGTAFVYMIIPQYQLLLVPIVLASIAGVYGPAFNATLTDSMQPELRARGIASFTLISSLPSMFLPYVGGLLMHRFTVLTGLRIAYFLSGLFGLIGVSYRALKLKETYVGVRPRLEKGILRFTYEFVKDNFYILRNSSSSVRNLLTYSVMASIGTGMTASFASLYVVNSIGLSPELYGLATNIAGIITVLLLLPGTRIVEKVGLKRSAIYASISVPVNQLIFVNAKGMNDLATWSFVGSASNVMLGPSLTALQANLSSPETRGRIMAMFSFFSLTIAVPAQVLGGYLYASFSQHSPFLASIPAFVLATFALTRVKD